jgi:hypothetical protein
MMATVDTIDGWALHGVLDSGFRHVCATSVHDLIEARSDADGSVLAHARTGRELHVDAVLFRE